MHPYALFWKKLGSMLSSGVPFTVAFEAVKPDIKEVQPELSNAMMPLFEAICQGKPVAQTLKDHGALHPNIIARIQTAEPHGKCEEVIAQLCEELVQGALPLSQFLAANPFELPPDTKRTTPQESNVQPMLELLKIAIEKRASDIHFEPLYEGGQIRLRVDGALQVYKTFDRRTYQQNLEQLKALARLEDKEQRLPQNGRAVLYTGQGDHKEEVVLRVSVGPTVEGETAVVHVLRAQKLQYALADPTRIFPEKELREQLFGFMRRGHGLLLSTGPSGCGKTTTLYTLMAQQDASRCKLVSVEDPVEVKLPGMHQIPLQARLGFFFPEALRHAMNLDPDVLFCGEIRDMETAAMLLRAALTGHLVLSQLHSRDPIEALVLLVQLGLEPYLLADALLGIVGQRLVRKLCTHCRRPSKDLTERARVLYGPQAIGEEFQCMEPVGCTQCDQTGYRGRRPLYELMPMTPRLRRILHARPTPESLRESAAQEPFVRMFPGALPALQSGETSLLEVLRVCPSIEIEPSH